MTERSNGRSGVGPERAMRARDLNRPTAEDLAEAEETVQIVRTNWRPPERSERR